MAENFSLSKYFKEQYLKESSKLDPDNRPEFNQNEDNTYRFLNALRDDNNLDNPEEIIMLLRKMFLMKEKEARRVYAQYLEDLKAEQPDAYDFYMKNLNEAKSETGINMVKKKLDALGVKYEMSKTDKVRPFKVIYKPINKSDQFYDKFEDIVDLFNLKGVVKSINEASKPLEENTTDWPKEVPSRHGDIIFRLVKVMPDRAKYELIDAETGKTWEVGGRVYGTVNQLKASAEDTIKPQGGRQSSQFESVNEAKTYKKGDKLKIKLKNGKKFDVIFDTYAKQKGVAFGKFKDGSGEYNTKSFSLDSIVESVNEQAEGNSYARVSKPRFIKDKNNPNFLNVYIDYDLGPGGSSIALGKETMTGQIRRESAAKAMKLAGDVARDLKAKYNLEDIEISDLENGKVRVFAVSDDFIDMQVAPMNEAKSETSIDMAKKQLDALGIKYEISKTDKVRPFKVIYKPVNKSDQFYDKFEDIVDLFNLKDVVKSSIEEDELFEGEFCPQCLSEVIRGLHESHQIVEAKYKGKTVILNKPMRGDSKKFKVYVNSGKKNADGTIKVKKVNFGHGGTTAKKAGQKTMNIRKSNPKARAAFRARHKCESPGAKTMARYWSCKAW
jgi:hypothetical protein